VTRGQVPLIPRRGSLIESFLMDVSGAVVALVALGTVGACAGETSSASVTSADSVQVPRPGEQASAPPEADGPVPSRQPPESGAGARTPADVERGSDEDLISRWKIQVVTIADVEAGRTAFDKPGGREWERFKANIQPGDEVWYFCSPGETWEQLMGWRGYAIFRKGRLVEHYTTAEN
jgi:hypothetical protein